MGDKVIGITIRFGIDGKEESGVVLGTADNGRRLLVRVGDKIVSIPSLAAR